MLGGLKLIAEPWDIGMGGYQLGRFPADWGEWNDRFRDTARRFWRGDGGLLGEMATRFAGSADVFAGRRRPLSRSVNFITAHDGFTLADLVSYGAKHNEANGEQNRDGTDANHSWNNGSEGPSEDPAIQAARRRDQRALLATLLLARGTPMLSMGDEIGRSQGGNNNAYAQDNATSWLDWSAADADLLAHARRLIALRLAHPALHDDRPLTGLPVDHTGLPDVEWLRADGARMTPGDWNDPDGRVLIAVLHAAGAAGRVLVGLNAGSDPCAVQAPQPADGHCWIDGEMSVEAEGRLTIAARTTIVLLERPEARPRARTGVDPAALDALAAAAGIAPDWWEVSGKRHVVSPEVQRALLRAMRLPADTTGDARASLMRLAAERDHRALPLTRVTAADRPIALELPPAEGRRVQLCFEAEDGAITRIAVAPDAGEPAGGIGCDGRPIRRRRVVLPACRPGSTGCSRRTRRHRTAGSSSLPTAAGGRQRIRSTRRRRPALQPAAKGRSGHRRFHHAGGLRPGGRRGRRDADRPQPDACFVQPGPVPRQPLSPERPPLSRSDLSRCDILALRGCARRPRRARGA